ncbi:MAG TPA: glycogen/starch/alpha-glucan phosphorylase, partial [Burkholderiaceae bacterium]|nr:glycogen/starch/alpha-glucan phosphorylase [Burkholderiaceae bacterium]
MDLTQFEHQYEHLARDVSAFKRAISTKLMYSVGKDPVSARPEDWLQAVSFAVRDHLVERWMKTTRAQYAQDVKRVYYLSAEFLIGRTFSNAMLALDISSTVRQALVELDVNPDLILDLEHDAALGNGGLGRLAACFLDSMATLGVPGFGYGIRYDYGMFRQQIIDGRQVEAPDYWLTHGNPWEFPRAEVQYRVRFGGHLESAGAGSGVGGDPAAVRWVGTDDVLAMAYDTIIPGYGTEATNTLRLWSAKATEEMNLRAFNQGNYMGA